ncbi:MAG: ATP-binding domain-containing protein, partial [Oscillospiraceae bacterium]|nr:ATP-binding domain-containing protein [Oscillospiraceae bacterium]
LEDMPLPEFYDYVCEKSSYLHALEEKRDMESRARMENVQELKSNILAFLDNEPEDATLSGFLNEIALYTDLDSSSGDNCVTMMTMHSAKGLEFPCVYVVGMEEGIFPGQRVVGDDEELEEERRLCYVAMTRAKEKLTLTNARQRMLFGRTTPNAPSRFLSEVPQENAEWLGKPEPRRSFGDDDYFSRSDRENGYGSSSAGYGGGYGSYGGYGSSYGSSSARSYGGVGAPRGASTSIGGKSRSAAASSAAKPAAALLQLAAGDLVNHKTFGDGTVVSVTPMGGDALVEVDFAQLGKKKLMLKTAGVHMTKK